MNQFLDNQLRPCRKDKAEFLSIKLKEDERLETYTSSLSESAQEWAKTQEVNPIGIPEGEGTKEVLGFSLDWQANHWVHQAPTFEVIIEPTCNIEDIKQVLLELKRIHPILNRGIIHRDIITFHLGAIPEKPCVAFAKGNQIGFPLCNTSHSLLATSICNANPKHIKFQDILLHELGHTLKKYLSQEAKDLARTLCKDFSSLGEEYLKISPHYLGDQHLALSGKLAELAYNQLDSVEKTVLDFNKFARKLESETFAEMVRFYYLEPCLTKEVKEKPKTPSTNYNLVAKALIEESEITINFRIGNAPFPKYGEITEF